MFDMNESKSLEFCKTVLGSTPPNIRDASKPETLFIKFPLKVAILVDGAFYQKRANILFGKKDAKSRASELVTYCHRHLKDGFQENYLYRIFYYDCPPSEKRVYHPLTREQINLKKTGLYQFSTEFFTELSHKRKVALRMGELLETQGTYTLQYKTLKRLCSGEIEISDLEQKDFRLEISQKGVDMRMGLDVASIAYKHQVDQIIMIAGDSDFVPAAKFARREGIDFILDPMFHPITPSLTTHIDGLRTCVSKPPKNTNDPLYHNNHE